MSEAQVPSTPLEDAVGGGGLWADRAVDRQGIPHEGNGEAHCAPAQSTGIEESVRAQELAFDLRRRIIEACDTVARFTPEQRKQAMNAGILDRRCTQEWADDWIANRWRIE